VSTIKELRVTRLLSQQDKHMVSLAEPSPILNSLASKICWGGALISAYMAQNMRERSVLGLPDLGILGSGSFRERFGATIFLPLSIITWTILYVCLGRNTWRCCDNKKAKVMIDGFPGWTYQRSLFHGGLFLPILLILAVFAYCNESGTTIDSGLWVVNFMIDGTYGTAENLSSILIEQVNCCVIGYLLCDFCGTLPNGMDWAFLLHHLCAIAGCSMCLRFPSLIGLIALNTVQCEFASCIYSYGMLYPGSSIIRSIYYVVMACSNVSAGIIGYIVYASDVGNFWKYMYVGLCVLLVALRCGGWILLIKSNCCGGSSDDVDVVGKQVDEKKRESKKNK